MSNLNNSHADANETDPRTTLLSMAKVIDAREGASTLDPKILAQAFLDALRISESRSADIQAALNSAFDHLLEDDHHLALQRLLLARHSSEGANGTALSSVAEAFGPRLMACATRQGSPAKGVLVALLLLRSKLPRTPTIDSLPAWHRQAIDNFDAEETLLLYNTMFGQRSFLANVAELRAALPTLDWLGQWHRHGGKKLNTLLYHWPAQADSTRLRPLLDFLENPADTVDATVYRDDVAALLRHILQTGRVGPDHEPGAHLHRNASRLWAVAQNYGLRRAGLGGRRPRIALCVSGQLRGYESTLNTWRKHLLPGVDADIYVHAWSHVGRANSEPFRRLLPFEGDAFQQSYREQCLKMGYGIFKLHYPQLFAKLAQSGEVTKAHISGVYGTDQVVLDDESDPAFEGWSNSRKMHYKIGQAQALVDRSGREYDMVLRIRPDKAVRLLMGTWADMARVVDDGSHLLADMAMGVHYGSLMIGDQVALATPVAMRIYGATYADALDLERRGRVDANTFLRGHASLGRQCALNRLGVGKFPALFGGLTGASPLTSTEIQAQLALDAEGRVDAVDQALLAAVGRDLAARRRGPRV